MFKPQWGLNNNACQRKEKTQENYFELNHELGMRNPWRKC